MIVTTQCDSPIVVVPEARYMELLTAEDRVKTVNKELHEFISELVRKVAVDMNVKASGGDNVFSGSFEIPNYKIDFTLIRKPRDLRFTYTKTQQ